MTAHDKERFFELIEKAGNGKLDETETAELERLTLLLEQQEEHDHKRRMENLGRLEYHGVERTVDVRGGL